MGMRLWQPGTKGRKRKESTAGCSLCSDETAHDSLSQERPCKFSKISTRICKGACFFCTLILPLSKHDHRKIMSFLLLTQTNRSYSKATPWSSPASPWRALLEASTRHSQSEPFQLLLGAYPWHNPSQESSADWETWAGMCQAELWQAWGWWDCSVSRNSGRTAQNTLQRHSQGLLHGRNPALSQVLKEGGNLHTQPLMGSIPGTGTIPVPGKASDNGRNHCRALRAPLGVGDFTAWVCVCWRVPCAAKEVTTWIRKKRHLIAN